MENFETGGTPETVEALEARRTTMLGEVDRLSHLVGSNVEGQFGDELKDVIEAVKQIEEDIMVKRVEDGKKKGGQGALDLG